VDLTSSSTFFLELEFTKLNVFGKQFCEVGKVKLFFLKWSAAKHPKDALEKEVRVPTSDGTPLFIDLGNRVSVSHLVRLLATNDQFVLLMYHY